jgi:nitrogenase molybdenum-iron protein alpha chain
MGPETLESKQKEAIAEVLRVYPEKAAKNREKHLGVDSQKVLKVLVIKHEAINKLYQVL